MSGRRLTSDSGEPDLWSNGSVFMGPREPISIDPSPHIPLQQTTVKADVGNHSEGGPLLDREIAPMLETSTATVQRVRERFCRQGLESTLERSAPDRVYQRSFDGRAEARLIALACSEAPQRRERWSMRLLADKAVEMGIVGGVSHETVRKTLKKTNCARTW
jgi:transposase